MQLAATVLGAFRRAADSEDLADVARELDVVSSVGGPEDFVTVVLVQCDGTGGLQVVNVAHLPPILIEAGPAGGARVMDTWESVPPLGLHPEPLVTTGTWSRGSRLLLYTDGTTESRDRNGTFFELSTAASMLVGGTLEDALDRLVEALTAHVGHALTDDVALVLAEHLSESVRTSAPGAL